MRKKFTTGLCTLLAALAIISQAWAGPVPPKITAKSAILVDAVTGKVLFERNCRMRRPPASTTKMMTAILALERGRLTSTVTASPYACSTPFGSLHLKPGETLTLNDLLYAVLLRSANDGAVAVAEHIAGSEPKFVELMNKKALEIGASDTHFVNPHGLYHQDHYSTAYDLAVIARYAVQLPAFNDIVRTRASRIERSVNRLDVTLRNTARFLSRFEGADGIKTGYTREAGHCFVGSATRNSWRLISVVLDSSNSGSDTCALMEYGFRNYRPVRFARAGQVMKTVSVTAGVKENLPVVAKDSLGLVLRSAQAVTARRTVDIERVTAPVTMGQKVGTLTGYLNDRKVGSIDLIASESIDRTLAGTIWVWARSVLMVSLIGILGFVTYGTAVAEAARRRRRSIKARSRAANSLRTSRD